MREVYEHTENKTDVLRNILASLYVRDPAKFSEHDETVAKVLKNEYMMAWPQGYIPPEHVVHRAPLKKTKEEINRAALKEKHALIMAPLNKFYLDDAIQNLQNVCTTKNAHTTYKTAGWKATFAKIKGSSVKEQIRKDQALRDRLEKELPRSMSKKVKLAKIDSSMNVTA